MTDYREILRLDSLGINKTDIAASCFCARNTVASVKFVFMEESEELPIDEGLIITGETRVKVYSTPYTYTVNTDEPVVWSIVSGTTAKISSQEGNSCQVVEVSKQQFGKNTLRVELVSDPTVFAELEIEVVFM
jgi:hypothetical protein